MYQNDTFLEFAGCIRHCSYLLHAASPVYRIYVLCTKQPWISGFHHPELVIRRSPIHSINRCIHFSNVNLIIMLFSWRLLIYLFLAVSEAWILFIKSSVVSVFEGA